MNTVAGERQAASTAASRRGHGGSTSTVLAVAYGLSRSQPAPLLRLVAEARLAAIGYSLLRFAPLDGAALGRRPAVVGALGLAVATGGVLFAPGML